MEKELIARAPTKPLMTLKLLKNKRDRKGPLEP